jgi:hypothetical protein
MSERTKIILIAICLIGLCTGCQVISVAPVPTEAGPSATPAPTLTPTETYTPWPAFQTVAPPATQTQMPTATRAPSGTPFPTGTATPVILGMISFPPDVDPLTGLKVADPSILNRRPVMVKVSNFPRTGRPHAGLSAADMVFEYYIGEYENRFMAVYYGQDAPRIGPLRSGRLVDSQLVNEYGGILVYGNADPRVDKSLVDNLGKRAITFDDAPCPAICGKETHSVEGVWVNSQATTQFAIQQKINNDRPDLRGMIFDTRLPVSRNQGNFLGVMFGPDNRGEWRYDPSRSVYLRWIEEERSAGKFVQVPLVDRNNGQQLAFENVIILYTQYTELLPTMFEMDTTQNFTGQRAIFFRDGLMVDGIWRSNGPNQPLTLMSSWGVPMQLKPGKSWIIQVGLSSDLKQSSPGQWELEYHTK